MELTFNGDGVWVVIVDRSLAYINHRLLTYQV